MNRSKKVFVIVAVLFFLGVVLVTIDISRKTTFPGSKKHLKESIMPSEEKAKENDSTQVGANAEEKNQGNSNN